MNSRGFISFIDVNIHTQDIVGATPLHYACLSGMTGVVELLCHHICDKPGRTVDNLLPPSSYGFGDNTKALAAVQDSVFKSIAIANVKQWRAGGVLTTSTGSNAVSGTSSLSHCNYDCCYS